MTVPVGHLYRLEISDRHTNQKGALRLEIAVRDSGAGASWHLPAGRPTHLLPDNTIVMVVDVIDRWGTGAGIILLGDEKILWAGDPLFSRYFFPVVPVIKKEKST